MSQTRYTYENIQTAPNTSTFFNSQDNHYATQNQMPQQAYSTTQYSYPIQQETVMIQIPQQPQTQQQMTYTQAYPQYTTTTTQNNSSINENNTINTIQNDDFNKQPLKKLKTEDKVVQNIIPRKQNVPKQPKTKYNKTNKIPKTNINNNNNNTPNIDSINDNTSNPKLNNNNTIATNITHPNNTTNDNNNQMTTTKITNNTQTTLIASKLISNGDPLDPDINSGVPDFIKKLYR